MEGAQIGVCLLTALQIRLAHNLHQRRARPVEVNERRTAEMCRFGDVLLKVDPVEPHHLVRPRAALAGVSRIAMGVERHPSADAQRQIKLGGLKVFGHIRIEITFAVPLGNFWRGATQHQAAEQCLLDGGLVEYRQGTGQTQAHRAGVGVRLLPERCAAGAEHLGAGFDLAVDFKADGD